MIKRIAEEANQSSDEDEVENMRHYSDESTPFPSRDHSPELGGWGPACLHVQAVGEYTQ